MYLFLSRLLGLTLPGSDLSLKDANPICAATRGGGGGARADASPESVGSPPSMEFEIERERERETNDSFQRESARRGIGGRGLRKVF
jgi:hypothetical protein